MKTNLCVHDGIKLRFYWSNKEVVHALLHAHILQHPQKFKENMIGPAVSCTFPFYSASPRTHFAGSDMHVQNLHIISLLPFIICDQKIGHRFPCSYHTTMQIMRSP